MEKIINKSYYEERPLYGKNKLEVTNCFFSSENDGESAFKETKDIIINNCHFSMRYPVWHTANFEINQTKMDELTRAAIWYCENGVISNCSINGVKCLRESKNILLKSCIIKSQEFGWRNQHILIKDCQIDGEYMFFDSRNIEIESLKMSGKYSFQYVDNMVIKNSNLDTKDSFWHSNNVRVENCVIKGEYLGWYAKNLTLVNCQIIGTQPLCYCEGLKIINCTMENADLAFEYSNVDADIIGYLESVKNVKSGTIVVDKIGHIINSDSVYQCNAEIRVRGPK